MESVSLLISLLSRSKLDLFDFEKFRFVNNVVSFRQLLVIHVNI